MCVMDLCLPIVLQIICNCLKIEKDQMYHYHTEKKKLDGVAPLANMLPLPTGCCAVHWAMWKGGGLTSCDRLFISDNYLLLRLGKNKLHELRGVKLFLDFPPNWFIFLPILDP